jgi:hypothetical protein
MTHVNQNSHTSMVLDTGLEIRFGLWYLTLLSTIFHLYHDGQETRVP